MKNIDIYTDGACCENPGPGGWCTVFSYEDKVEVLKGGKLHTTNNEMELTAVERTLKLIANDASKLKMKLIKICSDSAYVINAINQNWLSRWRMNNWKTVKDEQIKNVELWKSIFTSYSIIQAYGTNIEFIKVKGHAGIELNELADKHAKSQALKYKEKRGK